MNSKHVRDAGILLHLTSLPSPYGIGDLGRNAYAIADWMEQADIRLWQLLPLHPTGFGNSPYAPRSTFAGNELLIDLEALMHEGFLSPEDLASSPSFSDDRVLFQKVQEVKLPIMRFPRGIAPQREENGSMWTGKPSSRK
jgi:4-alpha-glucanotransferase